MDRYTAMLEEMGEARREDYLDDLGRCEFQVARLVSQIGEMDRTLKEKSKELAACEKFVRQLVDEKRQLEKLCRYMYKTLKLSAEIPTTVGSLKLAEEGMGDLGLLEGEQ